MGALGDGPGGAAGEGTPISQSGTLKNFFAKITDAPGFFQGNPLDRPLGIVKNGVNQGTLFTWSGSDNSVKSNTTTQISVATGDVIYYITNPDIPTATTFAAWGCSFVANDGSLAAPYLKGIRSPNISDTTFHDCLSFNQSVSEPSVGFKTYGNLTINNLFLFSINSAGASKSWLVDLRVDSASTALSATISGAGTTASDTTNSISVTQNSIFNYRTVPTGTPFSGIRFVSMGASILWQGINPFPTTQDKAIIFHDRTGDPPFIFHDRTNDVPMIMSL